MSSTFFTTDDGDIILRAGSAPGLQHDFRVHKLILSLASPVFKDMFAFPQPPDRTLNGQHELPVVNVPDSPEVLDTILRFIYPGVDPPKITKPSTLIALLLTADKYNITSICTILRDTLKTFLPVHPFGVYVVACRFGFLEEAKGAARVAGSKSIMDGEFDEEVRHISSVDLLRFVRFVQEREHKGRSKIRDLFEPWELTSGIPHCDHLDDGGDFYFRLAQAVEEAFSSDPCVGRKDILALLGRVPDPPPGCKSSQNLGNEFSCPLRPMTIRNNLERVAEALDVLSRTMLNEAFGKGVGGG